MRPRARRSGLVIRELPGEVIVYDRESHEAHCLNPTAALVFLNADGKRSVMDLAALVTVECGAASREDLVEAALETLARASLLEGPPPTRGAQATRREALRRVGLAAVVFAPVVTSLLVPTPAEAANTCIPEAACSGATGQRCYDVDPSECELQTKSCTGAGVCS